MLGFLLALLTIGQDITGLVTLLTPLAVLTGLFLYTHGKRQSELEETEEELKRSLRRIMVPRL